jgi:hypothetical protein
VLDLIWSLTPDSFSFNVDNKHYVLKSAEPCVSNLKHGGRFRSRFVVSTNILGCISEIEIEEASNMWSSEVYL